MLKKILSHFTLPSLLLFGISLGTSAARVPEQSLEGQTGTLEKMIVASGDVALDLDLNRLQGISAGAQESKLDIFRFGVDSNSFFTVLVFNHLLRGPELGSMGLLWGNSAILPESLNASSNQLVIEKLPADQAFELAVRDGKTGFVFFNVEGVQYDYDAAAASFNIRGGKLLISTEFAQQL